MKHTFTYWGEDQHGVAHTEVVTRTVNAPPADPPTAPDGSPLTLVCKATYYETPLRKAFVVGRMRAGQTWLDVADSICNPKHL